MPNLPAQAIVFMGIIFFLLFILVLLFLYLNKSLCFASCDGLPFIETGKQPSKPPKGANRLVESYGPEDEESSSDSEDEMILRYQQSLQTDPLPRQPSIRKTKPKHGFLTEGVNDDVYLVHDVKYKEGEPEDLSIISLDLEDCGGGAALDLQSPPPVALTLETPQFNLMKFEEDRLSVQVDIEMSEVSDGLGEDGIDLKVGDDAEALSQLKKGSKQDEGTDGGDERQDESGVKGELIDDSQLPGDEVEEIVPAPADSILEDIEARIGIAELAFQYSGENRRMNITVIQCNDLPGKDKGGANSYRLRLVIYPSKRQRAKTRIREGNNPVFKELFRFSRIMPHEIVSTSLRLRLYGAERMRKERLIGEGIVKFAALNVAKKQIVRLNLIAKSDTGEESVLFSSQSDLSDSGSSIASLTHGGLPELLVGLAYNSTTGRLAVEVIKGSHFKQLAAGRAPDSYVKVALMSSSGFEMTKSKSSVRRGQPNPTFKETFIFQIAQFQLSEVTLMFTVYNKKGMKRKDALGWFSMGLSNTSEEELAHWNEMLSSQGQQVCRWHALLEAKS